MIHTKMICCVCVFFSSLPPIAPSLARSLARSDRQFSLLTFVSFVPYAKIVCFKYTK